MWYITYTRILFIKKKQKTKQKENEVLVHAMTWMKLENTVPK